MKKFLTIAGNTILVILIIIGCLIGFSLLPIKKNYKIYFVTSGSMEPTISTGSMVVSKPQDSYRVDDIITFKNIGSQKPSDVTTHRISKIDQLGNGEVRYITKGDANNTEDGGSLPPDQIIGKELFSVPLIGYLVGYAKTLPGLILIIIIPATIIVFEEVKKIKNEAKEIIRRRKNKRPAQKKSPTQQGRKTVTKTVNKKKR
jgi:signal peptidase